VLGPGDLEAAGKGSDAITSGLEVTWTQHPTEWNNEFFENLFGFEYELTQSPAGANQWIAKDAEATIPGPSEGDPKRKPTMLTSDLALRFDPIYEPISRRFLENPDHFADAFGKAWYKLLHRDMGPISRYLGPWVPEAQLWQDPVPAVEGDLVDDSDIADLKRMVLDSGLSVGELVRTAWASASSYRDTDKRGGANGARIRLAPQKDWEANNPAELGGVLQKLEQVQQDFNGAGGKKISLADLIVLGGAAAIETAAKDGGQDVTVPFAPGRTDASQEQTDVDSFAVLEPRHDGFRNYRAAGDKVPAEQRLVDRAFMLDLTVPEMTVLVGGLRVLGANAGGSEHGVFTDRLGTLSNDFFVNLLDNDIEWQDSQNDEGVYEGRDRASGEVKRTATGVDLVFGGNSVLRAVAEVHAEANSEKRFVRNFVAAWNKVMNADRFDLKK
jgi:catalase-peroxidase